MIFVSFCQLKKKNCFRLYYLKCVCRDLKVCLSLYECTLICECVQESLNTHEMCTCVKESDNKSWRTECKRTFMNELKVYLALRVGASRVRCCINPDCVSLRSHWAPITAEPTLHQEAHHEFNLHIAGQQSALEEVLRVFTQVKVVTSKSPAFICLLQMSWDALNKI